MKGVSTMYRKPKDLNKFVEPKRAAAILQKLADAFKAEDVKPGTLVHFHVKIRVYTPSAISTADRG